MAKRRFHAFFILTVLLSTVAFWLSALAEERVPFSLPDKNSVNRLRSAIIRTTRGDLTFELFPEQAPFHVANFKFLADQGFYRNKIFHLRIQDYIVQGGVPPGRPNYTPRYSLPPEFHNSRHIRGSLGMARIPDDINPERRSHACQFHILLRESPQMDGNYTVFGQLVAGEEILDSLLEGDEILDVQVFVRPS
jgi:cyclophilin family peptidyl-prolyl cis-trans isomerase